jgi:hypothetical protein
MQEIGCPMPSGISCSIEMYRVKELIIQLFISIKIVINDTIERYSKNDSISVLLVSVECRRLCNALRDFKFIFSQ